jgi:hypothetical protein
MEKLTQWVNRKKSRPTANWRPARYHCQITDQIPSFYSKKTIIRVYVVEISRHFADWCTEAASLE